MLVTGAGGSIGSELCRQIHRFAPASLIMLDRDESALQAGAGLDRGSWAARQPRSGRLAASAIASASPRSSTSTAPRWCSTPQRSSTCRCSRCTPRRAGRPTCGAPRTCSSSPGKFDVERFVNISTDKAADATSVLGHTKRVAEQLTSFAGRTQDGTYLSVRFGNVLGSRGSVLPLFREQIAQGGPVTVTDPEVTRFFMTIPEACELVIQAGALASHDGKVLVLDMGEPVRIADLATRLIAESDRPVEIVYTGLRPGEKLHEVLFSPRRAGRGLGAPLHLMGRRSGDHAGGGRRDRPLRATRDRSVRPTSLHSPESA